jgi:hypothetical protein
VPWNPAQAALFGEKLEVGEAVFVDQEDILAVVASLGDVMRCADRHHPRLAGHGQVMLLSHRRRKTAPSPFFPFFLGLQTIQVA